MASGEMQRRAERDPDPAFQRARRRLMAMGPDEAFRRQYAFFDEDYGYDLQDEDDSQVPTAGQEFAYAQAREGIEKLKRLMKEYDNPIDEKDFRDNNTTEVVANFLFLSSIRSC